MITAFLHVVVDVVVITCISATWMESSSDKYDNTAQKTLHVHTQTYLFYVRYDP